MPIDKGAHSIEASAPGYRDWNGKVQVPQDGVQVATSVPPLDALPPEPTPPAPAPPSVAVSPPDLPARAPPAPDNSAGSPPAGESSQRTIGLAVGAVGVVGLGVSGVLALVAVGKKNDSEHDCPVSPNICNPQGVSQRNDALALGDATSWVFGISAGVLATGLVVWLTAPKSRSESAHAARVVLAPGVGGAVVAGTW